MINNLEQGRKINGVYYAGNLRWLNQEIARKRRGKLNSQCSAIAGQRRCTHVTNCHDFLFIVTPIVGVCNCSLFLVLLYVTLCPF